MFSKLAQDSMYAYDTSGAGTATGGIAASAGAAALSLSRRFASALSRVLTSAEVKSAAVDSATVAAVGETVVDAIAQPTSDMGLDFTHVITSLRKFGREAFRRSVRTIWKDKVFTTFILVGGGGFIFFAIREVMRLRAIQKQNAQRDPHAAIISMTTKDGKASRNGEKSKAGATEEKDKKPKIATGMRLFKQLWRLLKICSPKLFSRFNLLLVIQFFLLVLRTFLTINCVKNSISTLTEAISRASWKVWVRWFVDFCMWMLGGVIANSGLRFFESLIALEVRRKLTHYAHKQYLQGLAFYRATSMHKSVLDNIDNRIVKDIHDFSVNIAFLYGHSFKPVLEFILSLVEASRNLGLKRPIVLFLISAFFNLLLRAVSPQLGAMVACEAVLEGNFHRAHHRILANAEEIAFLRGAETERHIVDSRLDALINVKTEHTIQRIRKSVADNMLKFGSMLTGGIFVHVPFLLARNLSESKRMRNFRATEELMLRCGTSFGEVLLLGRELNELSGYTSRIVELLDALELVEKQEHEEAKQALEALAEADRAETSKRAGISVHVFGVEDEGDDSALAAQLAETSEAPGRITDVPTSASSCWTKDRVPAISFKNVTVAIPESIGGSSGDGKAPRVLVKDLTMEVEQGKSVLVTGPNGAGKTSLFRVLAGLWPLTSGHITRPSKKPVALDDLGIAAASSCAGDSAHAEHREGLPCTTPATPALPAPSIQSAHGPGMAPTVSGLKRIASHARTGLRYASSRRLSEIARASEGGATPVTPKPQTPAVNAHPTAAATSQAGAIMWLPQKPYMVLGTLRDQVTYPVVMGFDNSLDDAILEACELAGLTKVIEAQPEGLDTVCDDWETRLSGGERQKLGFARIFYNRPLFAVLDEATSAVHPDDEARLYAAVVKLGITIFSIAHRASLRKYHQLELVFKGDGEGGWELRKIED